MKNIKFMENQKLICIFIFIMILLSGSSLANDVKLHPMNKKLIQAGIMKSIPKYFPEIPRLTASTALRLYKSRKALFVLISSKDLHQIYGAIHLTEGQAKKINPNKLPFKKGQVLIVYCP